MNTSSPDLVDGRERTTAPLAEPASTASDVHWTAAAISFEVRSGARVGDVSVVHPERGARAYLGRSALADVRVDDAHVSRRHAAVEIAGRDARIFDLDSRNGTFVNGMRAFGAVLSDGDVVALGKTELRVRLADEMTAVPLSRATSFGRVLGVSKAMRRLYPAFARAAASDAPLLIEGETGTGKELLAEVLHEEGPRASGPFVVVDCALPADGAGGLFLDASAQGAFERARGGTLVLDEVSELGAGFQATLLHVLRLVSDVRVVATSRRDLEREVQEGRFREDLYYRLAATRIELPPLRDRAGDVAHLAAHFWRTSGGEGPLPSDLLRAATHYAWPGNVRELANAVVHRRVLGPESPGDGATPTERDVIGGVIARRLGFSEARRDVLAAFEARYLAWVLEEHHGNVSRAAAASGVARRYFYELKRRRDAR